MEEIAEALRAQLARAAEGRLRDFDLVRTSAIFTQTIILLLLIGGIFAIEALSVIVQVISFKYYGRRVFLMTPIHHHFEMKAWSEKAKSILQT